MSEIRDHLYQALKREVVGPNIIDPTKDGPYFDKETGEEVLLEYVHGTPLRRYGAAILYPQPKPTSKFNEIASFENEGEEGESLGTNENVIPEDREKEFGNNIKTGSGSSIDAETIEDDPISFANTLKPSSIGFTFKIDSSFSFFHFRLQGGIYIKNKGDFPLFKLNRETNKTEARDTQRSPFWVRKAIDYKIKLYKTDIPSKGNSSIKKIEFNEGENWLQFTITNRSTVKNIEEGFLTLTVSVINTKVQKGNYPSSDECLFQAEAEITSINLSPFDEKQTEDSEVKMLNLLYRNNRSFAVGHGIGVEWENELNPKWIKTNALPSYEVPMVQPAGDVLLPMYELSDKGNWENALKTLDELESKYEQWIIEEEAKIEELEQRYQKAAEANIEEYYISLKRIKNGIHLLKNDNEGKIVAAFRFMNRAMLWQQQRSKITQRKWIKRGNSVSTLEEAEATDLISLYEYQKEEDKGKWRPFQLAFILMNLESIVNPKSEEREIVELIWFPTGGGKTEAYLGVAAFTVFWKRMRIKDNPEQTGTTMLMRYTLRLLTTQQFERACSMIVGCDLIVNEFENFKHFGNPKPVSIGLWVGSANTPNTIENARSNLKILEKDSNAKYNFIVLKCPCCGAQIGKLDREQRTKSIKVKGLFKEDGRNGSTYFQCENEECDTAYNPLPIYVVDDDIYDKTPDLILATVDKLAMLPFKEEASSLFGFRKNKDNNSVYRVQPPELIIQDELHLISGPLGSMVGLYETMVQTLCNDYKAKDGKFYPIDIVEFIPPKIISSTATISRAKQQVKSLYAKDNLHIFPSQGLEFGNTWFSKEVKPSEDKFGRRYIGICPTGYPSAQTAIVRSYSAILQEVMNLTENNSDEKLDYYWTLVGYFNSIRELGGAITLIQADIIERLYSINRRDLNKKWRTYLNPIELTSRVDSSEIPQFLKKLEIEKDSSREDKIYPKDLCLATNMIATGVDISRFGLMFIHGQPKTTAEYIQASSRVGRDSRGPGIVFTLFNPNKPRDKSQYEQFQTYHSRIYSSVEPTSVTPFSIVARERALHAVFVGLIRSFSTDSLRENPTIENTDFKNISKVIKEIILDRVKKINPENIEDVAQELDDFIDKWQLRMKYSSYGDAGNMRINKGDTVPMLYSNASEVNDVNKMRKSNATPTSMRGVDTESRVKLFS